jgi:hypothetical protein
MRASKVFVIKGGIVGATVPIRRSSSANAQMAAGEPTKFSDSNEQPLKSDLVLKVEFPATRRKWLDVPECDEGLGLQTLERCDW